MAQRKFALAVLVVWTHLLANSWTSQAQTRRHIKVVLDTQQNESHRREQLQGSGGVVIYRGRTNPFGSIVANEHQTTVRRKSGVFTLVLDGSESILTVATRLPQSQIGYFHNYALGSGYIEHQIVFDDVGTSLRVQATSLPDGQIKLRLTPRISYLSRERPGAIDFTEAATELIVPNGQPVSLAGVTRNMHQVTRQVLGYGGQNSDQETEMTVTATIQ